METFSPTMFCVNLVIEFYKVRRKTKLLIIFSRNIGSPLRRSKSSVVNYDHEKFPKGEFLFIDMTESSNRDLCSSPSMGKPFFLGSKITAKHSIGSFRNSNTAFYERYIIAKRAEDTCDFNIREGKRSKI